MDLSIFFAGTGGSVPSARRGLPATLIRLGAERILIDCGEGTQRQLLRSDGLADLTDVFLTHHHADHWLGLPGMLKTFELRERERPLTIHGPPGTKALLERFRVVYGRPRYGLEIVDLEPDEEVRRDGYGITAIPVRHRGTAFGYALIEDTRPGRFDADLAQELGVSFGPDFGRLQRGETVNGVTPDQVIGPARRGRRIVLTGDTRPTDHVVAAAHQADVLVHEATFTDEDVERAGQTGHSTARQAAQVAVEAEVGMLALTHISTRYHGREIRDEARAVFANTEVPRDFDSIEIPLPDRGAPELHRWDPPRRAPAPAPSA
ncbi:MAG: ribonuclease Z [Solirubrobacteraceae bacterium]|nr:ribonuclease Z [Solirubrobacteraceae bacterium]